MPTLRVVARDDCFLPRGWVSAVLPDRVSPSEYERSGKLWTPVSVPESAELKRKAVGTPSLPLLRGLIYDRGLIKPVDSPGAALASRVSSGALLARVPGPESLDRSRSTVWDYGPGRTYSTPQAAFDALLAQEGATPFTEVHYIRGWSGVYTQGGSGAALALSTVQPSRRFPLVIDAATGEEVAFDDEGGDVCLASTGVSHVEVDGLKFQDAVFAVAPVDPSAGSVEDWRIDSCEVDGSQSSVQVGVSVINVDDLRVSRCDFHDLLFHGVGGYSGLADDYQTRVEVSSSRITASAQGLWNNASVSWTLVNNTIRAGSFGLKHEGAYPLLITAMLNNVFTAGGPNFHCLYTETIGPEEVRVVRSDGNCFHPGENGKTANLAGTLLDLAGWRTRFREDAHSLEADPLLDPELIPLRESPCLGAGIAWTAEGINGKTRTASLDMGCYQVTEAKSPSVIVRRMPEIVRR